MIVSLNLSFVKRIIKSNTFEFRFKYNTEKDYFYYDLFDLDGNIIQYHNKVVTGPQFDGFKFTSENGTSYATKTNIESFNLVTDE